MMIKLARWQVDCDVDRTSACYHQFEGPCCSCLYCRNFMAALDSAFPQDFRILASRLGIDVAKPTEVYQYNREPSGLHYFGGLFHFVGVLFDEEKTEGPRRLEFEVLSSGFEFTLSSQVQLVADAFKGNGLVQLDFATHVPWVLSEPDPL